MRVTLVVDVARPRYTVLGWHVTDIHEAIARLEATGVAFARHDGLEQDTSGVWTTPDGDRIAWFSDPDANVLSLTQFRLQDGPPPA